LKVQDAFFSKLEQTRFLSMLYNKLISVAL